MQINDKVDAVYIPDSPSRIKATDYNQIKNEIQECITEAGLTPTKDVIQLPQALRIMTAQSGAEEVAKIEAAGQDQLNAINTAGGQAVQDAQDAANTATSKATEAAGSATEAAGSASAAASSASAAASSASAASGSASAATTQASNAADSAASANTSASQAMTKAMEASASASQASQSAIDAANSAASARGLQIGSVYFSQSSLATDNPGALPLFTGETIASADTLYPDFYAWVKIHPELCKTKAQYDKALSAYGECPYYVADEVEGSLRLPKLSNYIKAANTAEGITQKKAGLPNITGTTSDSGDGNNNKARVTGAFFVKETSIKSNKDDQWRGLEIGFDASRSSAVYGSSDTVTPAHTTLYPWVYAFNSAVSASVAQAAEFQSALSGKADTNLGNVPSNYDYVVESQVNADGSWYRKYKSGWLEQGGIYKGTFNMTSVHNLLVPFANTTYSILGEALDTYDYAVSWCARKTSFTTTSFTGEGFRGTIGNYTYNTLRWEAKGQGA